MSFLDIVDTDKPRWYVVHTYSGYENKVKADLEKTVENRGLQNIIYDIKVPEEEVIEIKDGKKKTVKRKIFPGYVLIKMKMSDDSWYIVRNTRGVTGFVGPGSKPVPLTDAEVKALGIKEAIPSVEFSVGDNVRVTAGPLANFIGRVEEIEMEKQKVKVLVSMFGRETPVELDFIQIQKI
ncbi:transcription termination/antitermination protein NusG [Calorimonas adulescens]|jgi:transcription antitermination protein nusG|uniref:Transcription termination/antitermination protein NusG n=1 Tax=Calorimonas adulescens TaxID=2606906 RepID=A0A5D8QEU5_9THEO|nr:transcription termination/antitermination protein NusG [Calorimonas adulescens]TZE82704.1 transcription termination/antitermination protein NusG [Calorimonas adulescens]